MRPVNITFDQHIGAQQIQAALDQLRGDESASFEEQHTLGAERHRRHVQLHGVHDTLVPRGGMQRGPAFHHHALNAERPEQLEPLYARLREIGITDPTEAEETVEKITGQPAWSRGWSYKERRKEMLLALLDEHADSMDSAVDELGRWVDHLRQVGIRGFVAEHTNDSDFAMDPVIRKTRDELVRRRRQDETARGGTTDGTTPSGKPPPRGGSRRRKQ